MPVAEGSAIDLRGSRFLVVEDEFIVGTNLCQELEALGATIVAFVANVGAALTAIAAAERIDVALVDINLGGRLSTPVIDRLIGRDVTVILCSGYDPGSIDERFRALPMCMKPFTRAALLQQLGRLLPERMTDRVDGAGPITDARRGAGGR